MSTARGKSDHPVGCGRHSSEKRHLSIKPLDEPAPGPVLLQISNNDETTNTCHIPDDHPSSVDIRDSRCP
jgi:hypothetical protein